MNAKKTISAVLLAGGTGSRMNSAVPKQYLKVHDKEIARYSFDIFMECADIHEVIVVCEPAYQPHFASENLSKKVHFALPGKRRQDSVWNGLQAVSSQAEFVCIHDSSRPCISQLLLQRILQAACEHGAATVGMPVKFTLKEHDGNQFVKNTPDRSLYWEIQTPQVIKTTLLQKGFEEIHAKQLTITDDVSIIEHLQHPVKLVQGCYTNIKVTTSEDLLLVELLLKKHRG